MSSTQVQLEEAPVTPARHEPIPESEAAWAPSGKSPLRELLEIAWPTVLTMTSYTVMGFIDGLMVSRISPQAFTAQQNGGIYAFVPMSFFMGVVTMTNTFVAQHLGAGRPREAPRYAWNALWISVCTVFAFVPFAAILPTLFAWAGHDPQIIEIETQYSRILVWFAFFAIGARGLHNYFFGLHRPKIVFASALLGNGVNIVLNYILIFGHLGFPRMGVRGAAIGTVIGSACELIIPLSIFLGSKMNAELGSRSAWRPHWRTIAQLWRIGWPRAMTWVNELACWTVFMTVLMQQFGNEAMASGWIGLRYMHLSFMPAVGISTAVTAVVGRYIGAGDHDTANHRAWLGVKIAMSYMGICALCFIVFREPMVRLFIDTDDPHEAATILHYGQMILICAALFQLFDALSITLSGALAGAGDTFWPGVIMFIFAWGFIIGLGAALTYGVPSLGPLGPWIGAAVYIIALGIAYFWRWTSGQWRKIKLVDHS